MLSRLTRHAMSQALSNYPAKAVRIIVPLAPGGGNDTIARMIGQKIQGPLGQSVVIDNRTGAGGQIGAEVAAKSPPDGYTLLLGNVATQAIIPNVQPNVAYSPLRDFQPVSLIARAPLLVVVHPSLPVRSVKQLIAFAKAQPGELELRVQRLRQLDAVRDRAVQAPDGHAHGARSVQGTVAGDDRSSDAGACTSCSRARWRCCPT